MGVVSRGHAKPHKRSRRTAVLAQAAQRYNRESLFSDIGELT